MSDSTTTPSSSAACLPASSSKRVRRVSAWIWLPLGTAVGLSLSLVMIFLLGSNFHRLLTRLAGGLIGAVKDNQGISLLITGLCVASVWAFIGLICAWEARRELANTASGEQSPASDAERS